MKLSIITVNLNNKSGLQKTIDSVISQTYKDFEWIIIDGGSTDGSKELIKKYSQYITYWVSEPDKGIYNAMNKGIVKAKGEYLLFLNSGDYLINTNIIEQAFPFMNNADFVYGSLQLVNRDGDIKIWDIPIDSVTGEFFLNSTMPHPATFIKKEKLLQYGGYDESYKIAADWKFFMDAILFGNSSLKKMPFVVSVFSEDGISSTQLTQVKSERQRGIEQSWSNILIDDYKKYKMTRDNELVVLALKVYKTNRYMRTIARYTMKALVAIYSLFKKTN